MLASMSAFETATDPRVELLLGLLGQAYDRPAWHGPNLHGAIRSLPPQLAGWRPGPRRHNAREIVVHCAYWKYRVVRHLRDAPTRFDLKGSDWFAMTEEADANGWNEDRALLRAWHERLIDALQAFPPARLDERPGKSPRSYAELVEGAALHDVYHAGQIRLIARLRAGAR